MADDPNKPPTPIQEWKQAQEGWDAAKRAAGAIPPLPPRNSNATLPNSMPIVGSGDRKGVQFRGGETPPKKPLDAETLLNAAEQSERSAERDAVVDARNLQEAIEGTIRKYLPEIVAFVSLEALAIPFFHAGADAMLNDRIEPGIYGYLIGGISAISGFTFHWWKQWPLWKRVQRFVIPLWPAPILLAFIYIAGPSMYRRATLPQTPIVVAPAPPSPSAPVAPSPPVIIHDAATAEEIAKAAGSQISSLTSERDSYKRQVDELRPLLPQAPPSIFVKSWQGFSIDEKARLRPIVGELSDIFDTKGATAVRLESGLIQDVGDFQNPDDPNSAIYDPTVLMQRLKELDHSLGELSNAIFVSFLPSHHSDEDDLRQIAGDNKTIYELQQALSGLRSQFEYVKIIEDKSTDKPVVRRLAMTLAVPKYNEFSAVSAKFNKW